MPILLIIVLIGEPHAHRETILDLDWSSTPDMQSILAVGYSHRVDILCQQRMTYFKEGPGWALCRTIDISWSVRIRGIGTRC
jgi:hypothetical protein